MVVSLSEESFYSITQAGFKHPLTTIDKCQPLIPSRIPSLIKLFLDPLMHNSRDLPRSTYKLQWWQEVAALTAYMDLANPCATWISHVQHGYHRCNMDITCATCISQVQHEYHMCNMDITGATYGYHRCNMNITGATWISHGNHN